MAGNLSTRSGDYNTSICSFYVDTEAEIAQLPTTIKRQVEHLQVIQILMYFLHLDQRVLLVIMTVKPRYTFLPLLAGKDMR